MQKYQFGSVENKQLTGGIITELINPVKKHGLSVIACALLFGISALVFLARNPSVLLAEMGCNLESTDDFEK